MSFPHRYVSMKLMSVAFERQVGTFSVNITFKYVFVIEIILRHYSNHQLIHLFFIHSLTHTFTHFFSSMHSELAAGVKGARFNFSDHTSTHFYIHFESVYIIKTSSSFAYRQSSVIETIISVKTMSNVLKSNSAQAHHIESGDRSVVTRWTVDQEVVCSNPTHGRN